MFGFPIGEDVSAAVIGLFVGIAVMILFGFVLTLIDNWHGGDHRHV